MIGQGMGLTLVSTDDLRKALSAVYRGHLTCPMSVENLTRVGLQHTAAPLMDHLRHLDERAVRAVLVAVIAERLGA